MRAPLLLVGWLVVLCGRMAPAADERPLAIQGGAGSDIAACLKQAAGPLQAAEGTLRPYISQDRSLSHNLVDGIIQARGILADLLQKRSLGAGDAPRIHRSLLQTERANVLLLNLIERGELPPTERRVALGLIAEGQRGLGEASFLAHGLKLKASRSAIERKGLPEYVTVSLANGGGKTLGITRLLVIGPEGVVTQARSPWTFSEVPAGGAVSASFELAVQGEALRRQPELEIHLTYFSYQSKATVIRRCRLQ